MGIIIEYNLLSHTWNYFICYFVFYLTILILPFLPVCYMTLIFMFFDHPILIPLQILTIILGRWIAWWLSSSQYKFIVIRKGPSCKIWWSDWKINCFLTSYIYNLTPVTVGDAMAIIVWENGRLMAAKLLAYLVVVINPGLSIFHAN